MSDDDSQDLGGVVSEDDNVVVVGDDGSESDSESPDTKGQRLFKESFETVDPRFESGRSRFHEVTHGANGTTVSSGTRNSTSRIKQRVVLPGEGMGFPFGSGIGSGLGFGRSSRYGADANGRKAIIRIRVGDSVSNMVIDEGSAVGSLKGKPSAISPFIRTLRHMNPEMQVVCWKGSDPKVILEPNMSIRSALDKYGGASLVFEVEAVGNTLNAAAAPSNKRPAPQDLASPRKAPSVARTCNSSWNFLQKSGLCKREDMRDVISLLDNMPRLSNQSRRSLVHEFVIQHNLHGLHGWQEGVQDIFQNSDGMSSHYKKNDAAAMLRWVRNACHTGEMKNEWHEEEKTYIDGLARYVETSGTHPISAEEIRTRATAVQLIRICALVKQDSCLPQLVRFAKEEADFWANEKDKVVELLRKDRQVLMKGTDDPTLLHLAVTSGNFDAAQLVLDLGTQKDGHDDSGWTPLRWLNWGLQGGYYTGTTTEAAQKFKMLLGQGLD
eukprot:TRINITY_DN53551_c0_g1_i1.p1 TRINITY_DN53551_c0_g1~~TRINITY_DN53551_c0_g1_i1.p1  ORF type:complete len:496 (+),score=53.47 TRINITY_DN53551_c0_g1_i1:40-1527(+)